MSSNWRGDGFARPLLVIAGLDRHTRTLLRVAFARDGSIR